jgi:hypothetical protein
MSDTRVSSIARAWSTSAQAMGIFEPEETKRDGGMEAVSLLSSPMPIGDDFQERWTHWKLMIIRWGRDFRLLSWRALADNTRNYGATTIRAVTTILVTVLLSLVYQRMPLTQRSIQDRTGLLFFVTINQVRIHSPEIVLLVYNILLFM